jgi:nitrate reductase gamma subunit
MDLLEFARGPALQFSLAVFVFGVVWRLSGLLLLPWRKDRSEPRAGAPSALVAAVEANLRKLWPHTTFVKTTVFQFVNGYVMHVGLAIVVFFFAPHILFIKSLSGVSWPALPSNFVYAVGAITVFSLIAGLVHRLTSPVLQLISRADDYISWLMTLLPVATGLLAVIQVGARYETLLAIHILSICLFFIWFPFGKLMHAFTFFLSRGATGIRLKHRGAQI